MRAKRWLALTVLPALLLTLGAGCFGGGGSGPSLQRVTLSYWRVFDDEDSFEDIVAAYRALHPNVSIEYRKLRPDEYEEELIRAIAEGEGPDIFAVHNTKIGEFQDLLLPMPSSVEVTYLETRGTLRKETVAVTRQEPTLTLKRLKEQYVDVASSDVVRRYQPDPEEPATDRIFALPLAVDTLALYYNKDLLNAAGIAEAPTTWDAFQEAVKKITVYDATGAVTQSAAAMGTTANVERSADILSLLMLQNGTEMTDDRGNVAFAAIPEGTPKGYYPSVDAAQFYTDFANPIKDTYTWNETFPTSFEAFANGQTAFFLGYSYHLPLLEAAAPKLNFALAKVPQISGARQINYANYWVEGVSKATNYPDYAWDFIEFATSAEQVQKYLNDARKPTALRGLINTQLNDEQLGIFAEQVLTAKSWYRGRDADAMETALNDFADSVLAGEDPAESVDQAAQIVAQTYD